MLKESGMDFRHKEVVNINNGKRLGFVQRCMCKFRDWKNYFNNCSRRKKINEYVCKRR